MTPEKVLMALYQKKKASDLSVATSSYNEKICCFSITIFACILLAGLYGALHNQVTYTICPEYFTKFKYRQFRIDPAEYGGNRVAVAVIGFLASWMVGVLIGISIGLTALVAKDHIVMRRLVTRAVFIVFCTAIAFGVVGFITGKYIFSTTGVKWAIPKDVVNYDDYIIVGNIHNTVILGAIGIIIAIIYIIYKSRKQ